MSSWGTTSTSTTSGYYYSYGSKPSEKVATKVATIVGTKPPAREWSDVTEISIDGVHYKIDQTVIFQRAPAIIEEFDPERVSLRGKYEGDTRITYKVPYSQIKPTSNGEQLAPNPNRAFKRKKEMF